MGEPGAAAAKEMKAEVAEVQQRLAELHEVGPVPDLSKEEEEKIDQVRLVPSSPLSHDQCQPESS